VGPLDEVLAEEPAWVAGLRNDITSLRNDITKGCAKSFNSSAHAGLHVLEALPGPLPPYALPLWFPADVSAFFAMTTENADGLVACYNLHVALADGIAPEAALAAKRAAIAAHIGFRGV
jgi:hypothetical protein